MSTLLLLMVGEFSGLDRDCTQARLLLLGLKSMACLIIEDLDHLLCIATRCAQRLFHGSLRWFVAVDKLKEPQHSS